MPALTTVTMGMDGGMAAWQRGGNEDYLTLVKQDIIPEHLSCYDISISASDFLFVPTFRIFL